MGAWVLQDMCNDASHDNAWLLYHIMAHWVLQCIMAMLGVACACCMIFRGFSSTLVDFFVDVRRFFISFRRLFMDFSLIFVDLNFFLDKEKRSSREPTKCRSLFSPILLEGHFLNIVQLKLGMLRRGIQAL